jgi:hypothetical protein
MKDGLWQLIPHHHSGRLRHHGHTSYAGLLFVLLLTGILLTGSSVATLAAVPAVNPQSGSVGLTGVVRGPAPSQAAVIISPANGTRVSTIPLSVSGTCPANTFVLITKNGAFAGATDCLANGTFKLDVDLFDGQNQLVAKVSDALGQYGPDSAPVSVFYAAPGFGIPGGSVGRQLFLQADTTVYAVSVDQDLSRSVTIVGGEGPYAVSWDWGDGTTSLVSQAVEGAISASHSYSRPGNYRVIVRVTDSQGNAAFLQLVTIVNGPVVAAGTTNGSGLGALPGNLLSAWPLYILALLMVFMFWMGERVEAAHERRQSLIA